MADLHTNFAYTNVLTAPVPAVSGTTLSVAGGEGAKFPAAPFNVVLAPAGIRPSTSNAEVVRVTSKGGGDNWTIVRAQEGSSARTVLAGDDVVLAITARVLTDAELTITDGTNAWPTGGTVRFSNANGVSFGITGSTLTATVAAGGLTSQSNQAASASNGSFAFQTIGFSNANNVTFGTSAGSIITASVATGLTSQSNQAASASNGSFAFQTLAFSNGNNVTFGTSAGSIITASVVTGLTSQSAQAASASNGSFAFQTIAFSNANNVTFGTSAGSIITASVATAGGGHTGFISAVGGTASLGTVLLSNANGVSFGVAGQTVTASVAAAGGAQTGISGIQVSNATFTSGTVTFQNANGITFGSSGANGVSASHNALTSQSNPAFSASGGSSTFQTLSFNNANGLTFSNVGGAVQASYTVPAAGLTQMSAFAVSNTTLSTSGTIPLSALSFAGAGIASVGVSNGSVLISVPSGGGAGDGVVSLGMSTLGHTDGTTGTVSSGQYIFAGSGPISLSQSIDGQSGTLSILGPATSSLVGTGLVSISTDGSTISIGAGKTISALGLGPFAGIGAVPFAQSSISLGQNSLYLWPVQIEDYLTADHLRMPVFITNSTSAAASVQKGLTFRLGLYSRNSTNATVITLISSTSYTMAASHSSNASMAFSVITALGNSTSYLSTTSSSAGVNLSSLLHGQRELIFPMSTLLAPGPYAFGLIASTSSAGAAGNVLNVSNLIQSFHTFNRPGVATAATGSGWNQTMVFGTYSATTAGLPGAISATQINQMGIGPELYAAMGTV